jgi:prolipoprotein diacylglyceryl transferase
VIRLAAIPSPAQGVWHLGPFPLRGYALCILLGIVVGILITRRRWAARGGDPATVLDVATWAVPFGVVGGRVYHVITSPQEYFGAGGEPLRALYIWEGGLGIWGAVVLGGVGAWLGCRRAGVSLPVFADCVAPGILVGHAIGRWGNWFNNELYGKATDLPWALTIHEWDAQRGQAVRDALGEAVVRGTFHPTFLYESIWNLAAAGVLIWADRRFRLGHGRVFALYMMLYTAGRAWNEALRIDPAEHVLGLRLNVWTSILVFAAGLIWFVLSARMRPGREIGVERRIVSPAAGSVTGSDDKDVGRSLTPDEDLPR